MVSLHRTVTAWLDGEQVEVDLAIGPAEPRGSPFAGCREVDVIAILGPNGEDLTARADDLDHGLLEEAALEAEEDALDAAAEDQADADRLGEGA